MNRNSVINIIRYSVVVLLIILCFEAIVNDWRIAALIILTLVFIFLFVFPRQSNNKIITFKDNIAEYRKNIWQNLFLSTLVILAVVVSYKYNWDWAFLIFAIIALVLGIYRRVKKE